MPRHPCRAIGGPGVRAGDVYDWQSVEMGWSPRRPRFGPAATKRDVNFRTFEHGGDAPTGATPREPAIETGREYTEVIGSVNAG